ncbi:MAG TPA: hypothetical protein VIY86_02215, partial [Pirellulaceae bacterium]
MSQWTKRAGLVLVLGLMTYPTAAQALNLTWAATPTSTDWEDDLNWLGPSGQIPDDNTDTAMISGLPTNGMDPRLTVNRTVGALTVRGNGDFYTGNGTTNRTLIVQNNGGQSGTILIENAGSVMYVYDAPPIIDVDTDHLTINAGGLLRLTGGGSPRMQVDGILDLNTGGTISG